MSRRAGSSAKSTITSSGSPVTPEFEKKGVNTLAISTDTEGRARQMVDKVGAQQLRFGFGLTLDEARQWGLYISRSRCKTSIGIEEPELF